MASVEGLGSVEGDGEINNCWWVGRGDDYVRPQGRAREDSVDSRCMAGPGDGFHNFRQNKVMSAANGRKIAAAVAGYVRGSLGIDLASPALGVGSRATRIPEERKQAEAALVDEIPLVE